MNKKLHFKEKCQCFFAKITGSIILSLFALSAQCGILQQKNITINVKNSSVKEVLFTIQQQTGLNFLYNDNDVQSLKNITLNVSNERVENVLAKLLQNSNLSYIVDGKSISIIRKDAQPNSAKDEYIVLKGKVVDVANKPIAGATIIIMGSTNGAITNDKGNFSINIKKGGEIEVTYVGKISIKQKINQSSDSYVIKMTDDTIVVDDVVVTGIFTRKAESFTGSANTITGKELQRVGNQNVFQSLKNLDPSLMNIDNLDYGSDPNKMPELQLRGTTSFPSDEVSGLKGNYQNKPNQPLFVLDGFTVRAETIFDMDMNRVESITILKDAAAKAIYGSRAANGVVVIETKKSMLEKTLITYSGSVDVTIPDLISYNMANARDKLAIEVQDGFYTTTHMPDVMTKNNLYNQRLRDVMEGLDTYWLAKPLQTGIGTKHSISAEAGNSQVRVIGTFGYHNVSGAMKKSGRDNISGDINVSYRSRKLLLRNVMSVNSNQAQDSPYGSFSEYVKMNPYQRSEDESGRVTRYSEIAETGGYTRNTVFTNPIYDATINTSFTSSYLEFIENFYAEYMIKDGMKLTARFGVTATNNKADEFYPGNHTKFENYTDEDTYRKGEYILNTGNMSNITGDIYYNFFKTIGKHYLFVNIGGNISESKYLESIHTTEGFPSDRMNNILFARQYAKDSSPAGDESTIRDLGALAVFSYTYDDRFLFDGTLRESASSQFGENSRWGTFWSVGAGWNIHKEHSLRDIDGLNLLKIRASVGTTGNQNFMSYQSISTYKYYLESSYNGFLGAYLMSLANPDLGWERRLDYNVGFDVRYKFLSLKLDYYLAYTENSLTDVSLPTSNGFNMIKDNLGKVRNVGFEASLTLTPFQNSNGFLNLNFMFSHNKNKIVKISESLRQFNERQKEAASDTQQNVPLPMYEEGKSLNSIWAVQSLGIDPATGNEIYLKRNGERSVVWNANDQISGGINKPVFQGNFGVNGEYKGFGLSVVFRFLGGGQIYNRTLVDKIENINMSYNVDKRVLSGRWTTPGDVKQFKRLGSDRSRPMVDGKFPEMKTQSTTRFIQDRDELDFGSLNVYYNLNRKFVEKLGLETVKLSFYMNDIHKWSSVEIERGTEYPFARTMSFQLNVTF